MYGKQLFFFKNKKKVISKLEVLFVRQHGACQKMNFGDHKVNVLLHQNGSDFFVGLGTEPLCQIRNRLQFAKYRVTKLDFGSADQIWNECACCSIIVFLHWNLQAQIRFQHKNAPVHKASAP